jgi:hypothetical protein
LVTKKGKRERKGILTDREWELIRLSVDAIKRLDNEKRWDMSRSISKLEKNLNVRINAIVEDLDAILASEILVSWKKRQEAVVNNIAEKLKELGKLGPEFGLDYSRKRIVMTNSRPQKYWLDEHYDDRNERSRSDRSNVLEYALRGIKNWKRQVAGKEINVRDTLRKVLDYEEKFFSNNVRILPRSEDESMNLSEIYFKIKPFEKSLI